VPFLPAFLEYCGYLLLSLLLIQFVRFGHWRRFPFFAGYLFPMAFRAFTLPWARIILETAVYSHYYWTTSCLSTSLRLLVVWEVLRTITRKQRGLHQVVCWGSLLYLCSMAAFYLHLGPEGVVYLDVERKMSLVAITWAAFAFVLAFAASVRLSRPVWSMVIGLGIYAAVYLLNHAAVDLFPWFAKLWSPVKQFDFSIGVTIWLWGFWKKESEVPGPGPQDHGGDLADWKQKWSETQSEVGDFTRPI